tara:strand:+ start:1051 stop:1344 length:294 start_codon:yes stop_codon:yes gene_type:complete
MTITQKDIESIQEALRPIFENLETRFDSRFDALLQYMDDQFGAIDQRIGSLESKTHAIADNLDAFAKQMETGEQERLMLGKHLQELEVRVSALDSAA